MFVGHVGNTIQKSFIFLYFLQYFQESVISGNRFDKLNDIDASLDEEN